MSINNGKSRHLILAQPPDIRPQVGMTAAQKSKHAAAMSDSELCAHIRHILKPVRLILRENLPYIIEARRRFSQPGRRVPVLGMPSFTEWIRDTLGFSDRHVRRLLQEARERESGHEIIRVPPIQSPAAAMIIASAGFRLAHAVLHGDKDKATSIAQFISRTTAGGVLPAPAGGTVRDNGKSNVDDVVRNFQDVLGSMADQVFLRLKTKQREQALTEFFEAIASQYFDRALVDVVGLSPSREPLRLVYPGGKGRLASTIVSYLPQEGRTYIEPFAGRGNVFWAAAPQARYEHWWLNDLRTAPFFRAIHSVGDVVEVPPRTEEEYHRQWDAFKNGDQTAIILEPYLTFGGGGYGRGGFGGNRTANQSSYQRIVRVCHRIMRITRPKITSLDWAEMSLERLSSDDVDMKTQSTRSTSESHFTGRRCKCAAPTALRCRSAEQSACGRTTELVEPASIRPWTSRPLPLHVAYMNSGQRNASEWTKS